MKDRSLIKLTELYAKQSELLQKSMHDKLADIEAEVQKVLAERQSNAFKARDLNISEQKIKNANRGIDIEQKIEEAMRQRRR